jgi:putative transposase
VGGEGKNLHGPKPANIELSEAERDELQALVRRRRTPQQIGRRARLILAAAAGSHNSQIARQFGLETDTVRLWRQRWLGLQARALDDLSVADRLADAPRPGRPVEIGAEQMCQIMSLACEKPSQSERPLSQGTGREIADEMVKRGPRSVPSISPRPAARLLTRGRCNRT